MNKKLTIGLPVYNGEKFLKQRLENIKLQTFGDFEIIISDNASTDNTNKMCKEFMNNDNRIKYIKQEKNKGGIWNFQFLLNKANTEYFVWAGIDDLWDENFLKENLDFLENKKSFVGSISNVMTYGDSKNREIIIR